jgi:hypothetical protein
MSHIIDGVEIWDTTEGGLIVQGKFIGEQVTTAGRFAPGCSMLGVDGKEYRNAGSVASPSWQDTDSISTSEIASGAVTLVKLDTGITPSHVVKFAGKAAWAGSGLSLAKNITGVATADCVIASINTGPSEPAYIVSAAPTTNTVTFTLSTANTSNDCVIAYEVLRAAA